MFVFEAMTPDPITVTPTQTLTDINDLMHRHNIRRLPVVVGDRLVGIISDHDVMATMPSPATTLSRWEMSTLLDKLAASEIMTKPVLVVAPDCPLEEAARLLNEKKFGALPVMEGETLVGIITETDIFRKFVEMLGGGNRPGLRFELRVEEERGVLAQLAALVNDNGGNIVAVAATIDKDPAFRRVLVKEEGADSDKVRAALEAVDIEVLDVRDRDECDHWLVPR